MSDVTVTPRPSRRTESVATFASALIVAIVSRLLGFDWWFPIAVGVTWMAFELMSGFIAASIMRYQMRRAAKRTTTEPVQ